MCKIEAMTCKELFDYIVSENLENSDIPVCIVARCARTYSDVKEGPVTGINVTNSYINFTNIDTESYFDYDGKAVYIYGVIS